MGTARWTAKLGGICTRSVRRAGVPSLRMSSRAYSKRSKDFMTAGSRCWPALVSTRACGRRSKSCTPTSFSSAITCLDSALCEINRAFAAAVKLECFATPSKARNAFSGSQRRSMGVLAIALRTPSLGVADSAVLVFQDGPGGQVQMVGGPKARGREHQEGYPQRSRVRAGRAGKEVAYAAENPGCDHQVQDIGDQQRNGDKHVTHMAGRQIVQQSK